MLIVTTLCGCFDNNNNSSGDPPSDQRLIDQIKNNFINATYNLSSYKGNITGEITIKIYKGDETTSTNRLSNENLLVNISDHTLEHKTESITVGEDDKNIVLVYLIDNFKYTGTGKEGNLSWNSEELSGSLAENIWTLSSSIELFAKIIADDLAGLHPNTTWKRLKNESIDSKTLYVLHSEEITNSTHPTYSGYNIAETSHTFWIDINSYTLYKVKLNQIFEGTGFFAPGEDKRYMSSEYIFTYYDHNLPVKIELPPEAIP